MGRTLWSRERGPRSGFAPDSGSSSEPYDMFLASRATEAAWTRHSVIAILQEELTEEVDVERDCIACGQGAGAVTSIPSCAESIGPMTEERREAVQCLARLV